MKSFLSSCLIVIVAMPLAEAFSSILATTQMQTTQTVLKYTIIGGIDEKDDKEAEESFFAKKKAAVNGGPGDLSGYHEKDDSFFSDIDDDLNVDAYSNGSVGGIMPGFQLSGLCGDD
jgi:hypothetical protein